MHSNKEFAAGEYQTPQGAAQFNREWAKLKAALDELGPRRSIEQWKVVSLANKLVIVHRPIYLLPLPK